MRDAFGAINVPVNHAGKRRTFDEWCVARPILVLLSFTVFKEANR